MKKLDHAETERIEDFVQQLIALEKRNDERTYGGDPRDMRMRQLEDPSDALIAEAAAIGSLLRSRNIDAPELAAFIGDPTGHGLRKLQVELREIESTHGIE